MSTFAFDGSFCAGPSHFVLAFDVFTLGADYLKTLSSSSSVVLTTVCDQYAFFFQHAHFIPLVGVGKERRILIGPW